MDEAPHDRPTTVRFGTIANAIVGLYMPLLTRSIRDQPKDRGDPARSSLVLLVVGCDRQNYLVPPVHGLGLGELFGPEIEPLTL